MAGVAALGTRSTPLSISTVSSNLRFRFDADSVLPYVEALLWYAVAALAASLFDDVLAARAERVAVLG